MSNKPKGFNIYPDGVSPSFSAAVEAAKRNLAQSNPLTTDAMAFSGKCAEITSASPSCLTVLNDKTARFVMGFSDAQTFDVAPLAVPDVRVAALDPVQTVRG